MEALRAPAGGVGISAVLIRAATGLPAVLIVLTTMFDGAFIVRVPANTATGIGTEPLAVLFVAASTGGRRFF
jgi:hypothetical protein